MYVASGSPCHVALWEADSKFHLKKYPPLRFTDTARFALAWQGKAISRMQRYHLAMAYEKAKFCLKLILLCDALKVQKRPSLLLIYQR